MPACSTQLHLGRLWGHRRRLGTAHTRQGLGKAQGGRLQQYNVGTRARQGRHVGQNKRAGKVPVCKGRAAKSGQAITQAQTRYVRQRQGTPCTTQTETMARTKEGKGREGARRWGRIMGRQAGRQGQQGKVAGQAWGSYCTCTKYSRQRGGTGKCKSKGRHKAPTAVVVKAT